MFLFDSLCCLREFSLRHPQARGIWERPLLQTLLQALSSASTGSSMDRPYRGYVPRTKGLIFQGSYTCLIRHKPIGPCMLVANQQLWQCHFVLVLYRLPKDFPDAWFHSCTEVYFLVTSQWPPRGVGGLNSIPVSFAFSTILSKFEVTSSVSESTDQVYRSKMDNFMCYDAKCSAFQITRLIYVHCISAEELSVNLTGFSSATLCCKEIHCSYVKSMSQQCVWLVPKFVEDGIVDELFDGLLSPVLICINSNSDITVNIILLFYKIQFFH